MFSQHTIYSSQSRETVCSALTLVFFLVHNFFRKKLRTLLCWERGPGFICKTGCLPVTFGVFLGLAAERSRRRRFLEASHSLSKAQLLQLHRRALCPGWVGPAEGDGDAGLAWTSAPDCSGGVAVCFLVTVPISPPPPWGAEAQLPSQGPQAGCLTQQKCVILALEAGGCCGPMWAGPPL